MYCSILNCSLLKWIAVYCSVLSILKICSHFDLSSLISMARMQSAPKEDSKSFDAPTGDWTWDPSLAGRVLWPLSYRHLCTICAILSIYYWITDIHVWDVMHLLIPEQPHYRSYILVLISTYQVSSAWLECRALKGRKKRLLPMPTLWLLVHILIPT